MRYQCNRAFRINELSEIEQFMNAVFVCVQCVATRRVASATRHSPATRHSRYITAVTPKNVPSNVPFAIAAFPQRYVIFLIYISLYDALCCSTKSSFLLTNVLL